jgi:beta,beta-carotene 9',10'-dioxygenase
MVVPEYFQPGFDQVYPEINLDSLPVHGRIPAWLSGTLIRNGPGALRVGEQHYRHWFDGLAMLHRFTISAGKVSYANKFLESRAYRSAMDAGRITYSEFATDPCRSLFGRVMSVFDPQISDSAKVSIAQVAGRFMALAETPIQVAFDPQTLASVGVFQYEQNPVGQMTTVHPHFEGENTFNLVTRYHALSRYNFYRVSSQGQTERVASLPVYKPAYLHSFGMSKNYFILAEFPLVVNSIDLLLWLRPYIENFRWEPNRGTHFYIVDRRSGEMVGRFESEPFFAFHHVNAFEVNGELIVDINAYPDAEIIQSFYLNRLKESAGSLPFGSLRRYRIPLNRGRRGQASYETISEDCMELANFDYARFNTRPDYQYVYSVSIDPRALEGFYNQLLKLDVQSGQSCAWRDPGCYPGEPVFVGRPGRSAEDDGVILSVVLDASRGISFLLVLDAHSFTEIARAELPQPVLFGYHGAFFESNCKEEKS